MIGRALCLALMRGLYSCRGRMFFLTRLRLGSLSYIPSPPQAPFHVGPSRVDIIGLFFHSRS